MKMQKYEKENEKEKGKKEKKEREEGRKGKKKKRREDLLFLQIFLRLLGCYCRLTDARPQAGQDKQKIAQRFSSGVRKGTSPLDPKADHAVE